MNSIVIVFVSCMVSNGMKLSIYFWLGIRVYIIHVCLFYDLNETVHKGFTVAKKWTVAIQMAEDPQEMAISHKDNTTDVGGDFSLKNGREYAKNSCNTNYKVTGNLV